jgi:hypothetical protein
VGGTKLQIILLDVRHHASEFQKRAEQCEDRHCGPYICDGDNSETLLGPEQWDWLEAHLLQIEAEMRLAVSPIYVLTQSHYWDGWNLFSNEGERLEINLCFREIATSGDTIAARAVMGSSK